MLSLHVETEINLCSNKTVTTTYIYTHTNYKLVKIGGERIGRFRELREDEILCTYKGRYKKKSSLPLLPRVPIRPAIVFFLCVAVYILQEQPKGMLASMHLFSWLSCELHLYAPDLMARPQQNHKCTAGILRYRFIFLVL